MSAVRPTPAEEVRVTGDGVVASRGGVEEALIDLRRAVAAGVRLAGHEASEVLGLLRSIEIMLIACQIRDSILPTQPTGAPQSSDNWLTPDEVAARLKHTRAWVYRQARRWSFAKRPSRKTLLISEQGLTRWMEHR